MVKEIACAPVLLDHLESTHVGELPYVAKLTFVETGQVLLAVLRPQPVSFEVVIAAEQLAHIVLLLRVLDPPIDAIERE